MSKPNRGKHRKNGARPAALPAVNLPSTESSSPGKPQPTPAHAVRVDSLSSPPAERGRVVTALQVSAFQGPLPPPELLAKYRDLGPDVVPTILGMATGAAAHVQEMDKKHLDAAVADANAERQQAKRGQICGLILGLTGLVGGSCVVMVGNSTAAATAGAAIAGVTLVALVTAFLKGAPAQPEANDKTPDKPQGNTE